MSVVLLPSLLNRTYCFGEFEFSVRALELRKNGEVVRLQQQPLRVLHVLLDYAGEVVTRDEIRERVWPGASVSDFDNSLRVAINKLRQALGDDSEFPRYIETLPRRGYRWVSAISFHDSQPVVHEVAPPMAQELPADSGTPMASSEVLPTPERHRISWKSLLFTVILLVAALAAGRFLRPGGPSGEPTVQPLTTYPGSEYMPAFSPDGTRVAFAWTGPNPGDPYTLYFKYLGDERPHRLTATPAGASDSNPVWTPDGKSIYFFRRGGTGAGIYVVPAEGGAAQLVIETGLGNRRIRRARFTISPDGKTLAYPDVVKATDTVALFLLDLASKQSRQVTEPPQNSEGDGDPAFSNNGKTLAYLRNNLDMQQVLVMPAGGGVSRALVSDILAEFFDGLAWTTDDRQIIIGGKQMRRVEASGGDGSTTVIAYLPGPALFPSIRDDKLAYVQASMNANVWKLELRDLVHASGEPVKLISSTRQQAAASFSPDGSRIAFQSDRTGNWEIWVCNRDGSDALQLTHFNGPPAGTPRWSPDGKQIVFDARPAAMPQVYAISADGGDPRQITNEASGAEVPSWSRDGKSIYYTSANSGLKNVWKIPAQGGKPVQMTSNGGIYAMESFDGKYLYYSRSERDATLWRMPVNGGAEAMVADAPKPSDCSHWAVTAAGLYVITNAGDLVFYQFGSGKVTTVLHDQRLITDWSMAVSPDASEVVWAQIDLRNADLVLVRNFR